MSASKYLKASKKTISLLDQKGLTISQLKQIQSHLTVTATLKDPYAAAKIISLHAHSNAKSSLFYAERLFLCLQNKSTFIWNTMMQAFVEKNEPIRAFSLYKHMLESNYLPNNFTFSFVIRACIDVFNLQMGLCFHGQVSGFRLNRASIVGALTACAFLGALDQGRWIHAYVKRHHMSLDRMLGTALIDMYSKCGCIEMACSVFDEMDDRDVYAFTCLISGLANHDKSEAAIDLFNRMQDEGVLPNEVTFVDLLGRAGKIEEAKKVVREMPLHPDSYALGALLDACRVHGDVQLGEEMVDSLAQRCLDHGGVHVLLSNMYASADKWEDVSKVRKKMEDKNIRKLPGCSSIEVNGTVCEFVTGDRSYALEEDIMFLLFGIDKQLKSLFPDDDEHYNVTMEQVPS
ncbi:hypothetical protein POTOM_054281 [Populus tomentosa]|uniref:Pentatricopeptide repeat-containing protein n=1 Tax=Populus tomentosa TaxID=118781 RepID=A0A8X7Y6T8_POPTO|nr:hypothetical protein POTOM_054281 [Populus tomentosa]